MRKREIKRKCTIFLSVLLAIVILCVGAYSFLHVRRILTDYAKNDASLKGFKISNDAINKVIIDENIGYSDIVRLTKNAENNITALEIDIIKINHLKTEISSKISEEIAKNSKYRLSIPLGTFLANELTIGMGPDINFNMEMQASVITDFSSRFYSAGINQVLHQILITVTVNGSLVIPWSRAGFTSSTTVIAAQTVLVGVTPDAYTSVIGNGTDEFDDTIDNIFNFAQ